MDIFSVIGSGIGQLGNLFNLVISYPLGLILGLCYRLTGNYALSLLLFTIITRIFLIPLAVKQQRSSAEMVRMRPKIEKLQKKYAKDRVKLNEETMKLYQEENYSPWGGCLPMLIQLPIIYGLFNVVYKPLVYIMGLSVSQVNSVCSALRSVMQAEYSAANSGKILNFNDPRIEIFAAKAMNGNMDKLAFLHKNILPINFHFLGIDLSANPQLAISALALIPILCYLTQVLSSWLGMKMNKAMQGQPGAAMTSNTMVFLFPLMTAWISTTLPAAVGFYWICTNLFMAAQVYVLNKIYSPEKLVAIAEERAEKRREAIRSGKKKQTTMSRLAQMAIEEQKKKSGGADVKTPESDTVTDVDESVDDDDDGKKSKRMIKEENRKRLAESRKHESDDSGGNE